MELIYVDACLLIYLVERHERWAQPVSDAVARAENSRFALSPLIKLECLVGPMKMDDSALHRAYMRIFERFVTLDMPEAVFLDAAALRANYALKTPDALHLACAQHHQCTALWTNDGRLERAAPGLVHNVLTG